MTNSIQNQACPLCNKFYEKPEDMKFAEELFVNQIEVDYSFFLSADHFYRNDLASNTELNSNPSEVNFGSRESVVIKKKFPKPAQLTKKDKRMTASDGHVNVIGLTPISDLHMSKVMEYRNNN